MYTLPHGVFPWTIHWPYTKCEEGENKSGDVGLVEAEQVQLASGGAACQEKSSDPCLSTEATVPTYTEAHQSSHIFTDEFKRRLLEDRFKEDENDMRSSTKVHTVVEEGFEGDAEAVVEDDA